MSSLPFLDKVIEPVVIEQTIVCLFLFFLNKTLTKFSLALGQDSGLKQCLGAWLMTSPYAWDKANSQFDLAVKTVDSISMGQLQSLR